MALSNYLPYNFMLTQITGTPIVPVICGSIFAAGKGRIFMQTRNRQFVSVLIGAFIYAVSMVSLVKPVHIAPGGATGVALMLNYLFGLPVGAMSFSSMSLFLPRRGNAGAPICPKDNGNGPSLLFLHGQGCRCLFSCLCWTAFLGLFWAAPFQALA